MEAIEKIIWQYIDGTLTESEHLEVRQKIISDPKYKSAYDSATNLAENLKELKPEKAPAFLLSNIMLSIKDIERYSAPNTSFAGLKYVIGMMLGLAAVVSLITINLGKEATATASKWDVSKLLADKTSALQFPEVPSLMAESLPYASVFGILLFVYWMDIYYNKLKFAKARK